MIPKKNDFKEPDKISQRHRKLISQQLLLKMDRRKQGKKFKQKNVGKPVDVEALKQDMLNALYVAGKKCVISRNDSMAASIDSGSHLIPWNEKDKNRMIDRFDGRIFFDMESQFVYKKPLKESISTSEEEKMCDEERYFDLFNRVEEDKETKEILKRKAEMDPTEDGMYFFMNYKQKFEEMKMNLHFPFFKLDFH